MRALVAVLVAFLFLVPAPAMGQSRDAGEVQDGVVLVPSMDVLSAPGTLLFERPSIEFPEPVVVSTLGLDGTTSVYMEGLDLLNYPGLPRVPVRTISMELPPEARVVDIRAAPGPAYTMFVPGGIEKGAPWTAIGPTGPIEGASLDTYYDGDRFPADWFTYDLGRGLNADGRPTVFVDIFAYPLIYEEAEGAVPCISYIKDLDIEISYWLEEATPSSRRALRDSTEGPYDMIIIGPVNFKDNLQDLADHKNETGLRTRFVTLDEIYDGDIFTVQGRDDPERIKYFIKDAIENWDTVYVLFGGDVDWVPTRHVEIFDGFDDDASMWTDGKWVASDIYFGDIYDDTSQFSSWDENGNNIFGQWTGGASGWAIDDPDFFLDAYVGRLPGSDAVEIGVMVNKIILYETNDDWSWFFNAGLAGVDTWVNDGGYNVAESEYGLDRIGEILQPKGYSLNKMYETQGTLSPTAINNAINNGLGVMLISGHGSYTAWGSETGLYYDVSYIQGLNNGVKLPIGSQAACQTGGFDNEDDSKFPNPWVDDAMAEEFVLRNGGGYIIDWGASRVAYGMYGPFWTDYASGYLHKRYYNAMAEGQNTPGKMFNNARIDYMNQHGTGYVGDYKHMNEYNIMGDPSLAFGGIGLSMTVDKLTAEVGPGETVEFNVTIKNVGPYSESVDIGTTTTGAWSTGLSIDHLELSPGDEGSTILTVTAGDKAIVGQLGTFTIKATSERSERSVSKVLTTSVKQIFGLDIDADPVNMSGLPGEDVAFGFSVINTGNGDDGASLVASGIPSGWGVYMQDQHVDLAPFGTTTSSITLTVPDQVLAGSIWFNVTATLDGSPIIKVLTLRVDVEGVHDIDMVCVNCSGVVDPGETLDLVVDITNLGNIPDDIGFNVTVPSGWVATLDSMSYSLQPYASEQVTIEVKVDAKALAKAHDIIIQALIPEETVEVVGEVTVNRIYGLELSVSNPSAVVDDGGTASFSAFVKNLGNGPDTVKPSCTSAPQGWMAQGDPSSFVVGAFESYSLDLDVDTTEGSLAGMYQVDMKVETQGDVKVSDEVTLDIQIAERVEGRSRLKTVSDTAYPGSAVLNKVIFENLGNVEEVVSLSASDGNGTLSISALEKGVTVAPEGTGEISFYVNVPPQAIAGPHIYNIMVEKFKGVTEELSGTIYVDQVYGFDIVIDGLGYTVEQGDHMVKKVTIRNTGNGEDTFIVGLEEDTPGWTSVSEGAFTLAPGDSRVIYVNIDPPENAAPEYHDASIRVTSECGASKEDLIDFRITSSDEVSVEGSAAFLLLPLVLILVVVAFVVSKAIMDNRRGGGGPRRAVEEDDEGYLE
jgi:uncharacterized membrane protein